MTRFIVRYKGKGAPPLEDVDRIKGGARVVDQLGNRAFLVEADEPDATRVQALVNSTSNWAMSVDKEYAIPDPTPQVLQPPPMAQKG